MLRSRGRLILCGVACLGAVLGIAIPNAGCGLCEHYQECTTLPSLRMVGCGESYEFSDGSTTTDFEIAQSRCFCPFVDAQCVDGRVATMCTPVEDESFDGAIPDRTFFIDGTETSFAQGYAICNGYAVCGYAACSLGRWFLECRDADNDAVFIVSTGEVFDNLASAKIRCDEAIEGVPDVD